jgi:polysaccharide pyruvyl transferase WcaK-like protein
MAVTKILLQGYIGHKNFGDDLLFDIALKKIKNIPNTEITVLLTKKNINPDYLYIYYPNLKIIKFDSRIPLLFYKNFDKVFYIGGGVFFDYKKGISILTFLKNYLSNILRYNIPKLLGTRFAGIGIGIGPYFSGKTKNLHAVIIRNFEILGVRDKVSFEIAKSMGVSQVYLSNDLSIGLFDKFNKISAISDKSNQVIICPRTYSHKVEFEKHLEELVSFSYFLEKTGFKTHWIFLQEDDFDLVSKLRVDFNVTIWDPYKMSIMDFIKIFKNAKVIISSRMHSIFIAGMVGTPFIAIPLHQKLIYASELFYKKPVFVDPMGTLDDYKIAFSKIEKQQIISENVVKESFILIELNNKIKSWLEG